VPQPIIRAALLSQRPQDLLPGNNDFINHYCMTLSNGELKNRSCCKQAEIEAYLSPTGESSAPSYVDGEYTRIAMLPSVSCVARQQFEPLTHPAASDNRDGPPFSMCNPEIVLIDIPHPYSSISLCVPLVSVLLYAPQSQTSARGPARCKRLPQRRLVDWAASQILLAMLMNVEE
jgi:hypothetical protein